MRGIEKVRAIYYFLYSTEGTQEQIYCHFLTSPNFSIQLLLSVHDFPDAICEECFHLCRKLHMHCILDIFIFCKLASM